MVPVARGFGKQQLTPQVPSNSSVIHSASIRPLRPQKKCSALLIGTGGCVQYKTAIPRRQLDRQSKSPLDGVFEGSELDEYFHE